jgi:hypothetical protein
MLVSDGPKGPTPVRERVNDLVHLTPLRIPLINPATEYTEY